MYYFNKIVNDLLNYSKSPDLKNRKTVGAEFKVNDILNNIYTSTSAKKSLIVLPGISKIKQSKTKLINASVSIQNGKLKYYPKGMLPVNVKGSLENFRKDDHNYNGRYN
jgi:hypothetical protein